MFGLLLILLDGAPDRVTVQQWQSAELFTKVMVLARVLHPRSIPPEFYAVSRIKPQESASPSPAEPHTEEPQTIRSSIRPIHGLRAGQLRARAVLSTSVRIC